LTIVPIGSSLPSTNTDISAPQHAFLFMNSSNCLIADFVLP
jgi:hypothetical protein